MLLENNKKATLTKYSTLPYLTRVVTGSCRRDRREFWFQPGTRRARLLGPVHEWSTTGREECFAAWHILLIIKSRKHISYAHGPTQRAQGASGAKKLTVRNVPLTLFQPCGFFWSLFHKRSLNCLLEAVRKDVLKLVLCLSHVGSVRVVSGELNSVKFTSGGT